MRRYTDSRCPCFPTPGQQTYRKRPRRPFAGIGLYEISRCRELGLDTSWKHAFAVVRSHAIFPILSLGLLLGVIFACWECHQIS